MCQSAVWGELFIDLPLALLLPPWCVGAGIAASDSWTTIKALKSYVQKPLALEVIYVSLSSCM